ncbi:hypothetical protein QEG98_34240 [Myxococcus sp. MxC21-1]|uniref:hypothetical protein n=1 Tax=Myxococcus sp. MxC21-1 TaxID=3041439 RepID=UPI00292FD9B8|nr:hypothetical protein [Myxococcus sp. MxC21-1]WNZ60936.1 hypothetical protein QEG98_34240 [Myxococcus sp. MxC21-1]
MAPRRREAAEALATHTQALLTGTPASTGVLAFLNSRSTTVTVLDIDAPLDSDAAQNLIAYRDGPDGVASTADDRHFVSIAQVDAVPQVGTSALAALEAYARATGRLHSAWVEDTAPHSIPDVILPRGRRPKADAAPPAPKPPVSATPRMWVRKKGAAGADGTSGQGAPTPAGQSPVASERERATATAQRWASEFRSRTRRA